MKWLGIALTRNGIEVLQQLKEQVNSEFHHSFLAYTLDKYADQEQGMNGMGPSVKEFVHAQFNLVDGLVFVCATGIAVREIAPCVRNKTVDPAVIVIDEGGNYVISLLSGHFGGANEWARRMALMVGGNPVITTATDVNGLFAVDEFAKNNNLWISSMKQAKNVSAHLCEGHQVSICSNYPIEGSLPKGLTLKKQSLSIYVDKKVAPDGLSLIPKTMSLGIGCKKNTNPEVLEAYIRRELQTQGIPIEGIVEVCSIDVKKEEKAIQMLCTKLQIPYHTYSKEELNQVPGIFDESEFVRQTVGVGNVCERAAMCGARNRMEQGDSCESVLHKRHENGVTMAVVMVVRRISYE